jgi:addiction module HigA family antidote|uniref:Addiction module antidote protein, HigA family n=1 Tax=Leptospirillum ferriphilum TaxID=178606 RepID=A0A7C3LWM4_9BACT
MNVSEAARRLGVTRQALSTLLNGRSDMSVEMALRLESALGIEADFWLRMQLQWDLWSSG